MENVELKQTRSIYHIFMIKNKTEKQNDSKSIEEE